MNFSVLMSVYYKESPAFLDVAFQSIYDHQTLRPSEIVVVKDGPLTPELDEVLSRWGARLGKVFKIVGLSENQGLGPALSEGLSHCSYDLVARMDSDDIALPDRFEKQIAVFQEGSVDVCGSWVGEFEEEGIILGIRRVPKMTSEMKKYSKTRNPINHPTVMFLRSAVLASGGYRPMLWFEDYFLWCRMLHRGARFYNIQEVLLSMRVSNGFVDRRRGLSYLRAEFLFWSELRQMGYINSLYFYGGMATRCLVRLLPRVMVKRLYGYLRTDD